MIWDTATATGYGGAHRLQADPREWNRTRSFWRLPPTGPWMWRVFMAQENSH